VDGSQLSEDRKRGRLLSRQWWDFWSIEGDELWTSWATVIVSSICDSNFIRQILGTEYEVFSAWWVLCKAQVVHDGYWVRLSLVVWLRILVGSCWCVYVALFRSRLKSTSHSSEVDSVYVALFRSRLSLRRTVRK
jgi:hypothetical protein